MTKLKPCPFCGGEAILETHMNDDFLNSYYRVVCESCGVKTLFIYHREETINFWNRRAYEKH